MAARLFRLGGKANDSTLARLFFPGCHGGARSDWSAIFTTHEAK